MKKKVVYDIETLFNCFTYSDIDIETKEINQFVIHQSRNQLKEFINYLGNLSLQIGFNNKKFDGQIIQFIMTNYKKWENKTATDISKIIYDYSQYVISLINGGGWPDYADWHMIIPQMDLFLIWHFDNKSKMTSLKWIEYMIDMDNIEEMPLKHTALVKEEEIQSVLDYNMNDVFTTLKLYEITTGNTNHPLYKDVDKIQLRRDIEKEFNIKCTNYNDVKIGNEINKISYCAIKNISKNQLPRAPKSIQSFKFSDCFPKYTEFKTDKFKNFVSSLGNVEVNLEKKQEFLFKHNETSYCVAKGGIHSEDKPRIIKPNKNQILRDADIGLMWLN